MSDVAEKLMDEILEAWNNNDIARLRACHTEDWVDHTAPAGANDLAALEGVFALFHSAFPDLELDIPKAIVNGDEVAYLYTVSGTHAGDFMGVAATGREVDFKGTTMLQMRDGRCAEAWGVMDMLALMQQIGAIPVPQG